MKKACKSIYTKTANFKSEPALSAGKAGPIKTINFKQIKKISNFISPLLIFISLSLFLTNCTVVESEDQATETNFGYETEAVANILNVTCAKSGCHSGSAPVDGLSTETHTNTINGASRRPYENGVFYSGEVVIPYNAEKSLLMQFVEGKIETPTTVNHVGLSDGQLKTLSDWIEDGAKDYRNVPAFDTPGSYRVYVCNSASDNISTIDGSKKLVSHLSEVNNSSTFEETPYWVAEYGSYYYVSLSNENKLLKVRKSDNTIVGSISNIVDAGMVEVNSTGSKVYVSRAYNSTSNYSSIYVINTGDMSLKTTISFPNSGLLHGLALDGGRKFLYVADATNNIIYIIDTVTDQLVSARLTLTIDYYPLFVEVSLNGNYLYISAKNTNELLVMDAGNRSLISTVPLLSNPMGIAVSSFGDKIYIASNGGDAVDVVTKTGTYWSKTKSISHSTMSMPFGIDITSDDSYLYVTNQNLDGDFIPAYEVTGEENISTVSIINTSSETVVKVLEVEEEPHGIVVEKL